MTPSSPEQEDDRPPARAITAINDPRLVPVLAAADALAAELSLMRVRLGPHAVVTNPALRRIAFAAMIAEHALVQIVFEYLRERRMLR